MQTYFAANSYMGFGSAMHDQYDDPNNDEN